MTKDQLDTVVTVSEARIACEILRVHQDPCVRKAMESLEPLVQEAAEAKMFAILQEAL